MMKKQPLQQAPVSLTGLFGGEDSDEEQDNNNDQHEHNDGHFENESEVKVMDFCGIPLKIRQMAWHRANANQVWPGTFTLLEHIFRISEDPAFSQRYLDGMCLELGSATGALPIAMQKKAAYQIITCDIDDEGEVEAYVKFNYELNDMQAPRHIPHTWGAVWQPLGQPLGLKYIIASDILLYVSAYPALVQSLLTIFHSEPDLVEFLMSWNRRIAESAIFFNLMKEAGFQMYTYGHGLYSFYLTERMDAYLTNLPPETVYNANKRKA